MSGSNQHLCTDDDLATALVIESEVCGDCNSHCDFEPGKSNAVTIELTITNNEVNDRYFCAIEQIDTDHTQTLKNDLPSCDEIYGKGNSESYTLEVYHDNGPDGDQESISFEIFSSAFESDCESIDTCEEMDDTLGVDVDVKSNLEFSQ